MSDDVVVPGTCVNASNGSGAPGAGAPDSGSSCPASASSEFNGTGPARLS
jgi:hypothetical protein